LLILSKSASDISQEPWLSVYIGLGGNIGEVVASMAQALHVLDKHPSIRVLERSNLYTTPPWGDLDQDDFINACAKLETRLPPEGLLVELKKAEKHLKRKRTRRWGPRTIDLDILFFEGVEMKTETLEIPHPRMTERGFVLMPLNDLAPGLTIKGRSVNQWLKKIEVAGINRLDDHSSWISGH
jgi:2-amino-4-hydroxy-6-hydroxymethyldihydropteridine diphosphokinase